MNRPTTALIAVSCLALVSLAGCASSAPRAQSDGQHAADTDPGWARTTGTTRGPIESREELVLGSVLDDGSVPVYPEPVSRYTMGQIQSELEEMYDLDRQLVRAAYDPSHDQHTIDSVKAIDRAHCERLREIVEHIGWPTRDLVGLKATQGAYMVIQHAGYDIDFQNRCLAMMVDLVEQGELPASYVALLTDRIRVFQDRPQVFGTQMTMARNEMGVMVPTPTVPIEDPGNLDQRRRLMGMAPHADFKAAIQIAYESTQTRKGSALAGVNTDD